ncbi:MAG: hypothetical protein LWX02_00350 [Deltaproteobacteria bacterium]|nr:hypothetical protein [Deltaproteobacteria bacterium]MDL1987085.1 hypothetical protein [Deltaproteobacteria bacterium]
MPKKKGKSISFDVMVKFFMRHYDIPTKKDLAYLMTKIDRLETLIKSKSAPGKSKRSAKAAPKSKGFGPTSSLTASDMVMGIIKKSKQGADFAGIQAETGFGEKKLRNIIFRLNQTKKIKRKTRGVYIVS